MGTRLPPSHAPAWGRRRQEEGAAEPQRGENVPGNGRALGHEGRTELKTESLIDRIQTREVDAEDRNKQRRIDEEAYQQQILQRQREDLTKRVHFETHQFELGVEDHEHHELIQEHAPEQAEARPGKKTEPRDPHRQALLRATAGLDRATQLLMRGQGPEACLVLLREATEARSFARSLDRDDPLARVLSALASNMQLRGEAIRTTIPGDAKRIALRLEQIARATETRADNLSSGGQPREAQLLKKISVDSRLQAQLVRAGADNTDALLGRALARVLSGVVKEGSPKSELALDRALRDLDRSIDEERVPFHRALQPESKRKKTSVDTERTVNILKKNDRAKGLLDPLRELSTAISRGDPRAVATARNKVLDVLVRTGLLPHLERVAQSLPGARTTSSPTELLERALPRLLLDGVKNGTIKELAKSAGLEPWLKSLPPPPSSSRALLPGEKALVSHGTPLLPADLGPIEALLLGGPSLFTAQATVSKVSAKGLEAFPAAFAADPSAFVMLPPAGRHEQAVLLAPDGSILVRTDEGPLFFQGHLTGADEQRYYYRTLPLDDELRRVVYTNAADLDEQHVRIDMGIDQLFDELDEGELLPSRSKRRKKKEAEEGESSENLAAVAIFTGSDAPGEGFQGFATRHSARRAEQEIERINQDLVDGAQIGHLYLEYANDVALRLRALGCANTEEFQARLDAAIEERGFTVESVGALILISPDASLIAHAALPDPKDPSLLEESLLLYPCSVTID